MVLILPEIIAYAAIAAWVITQAFTLWAARWVVGRARDESVRQKNEVVDHFDTRLGRLEEQIPPDFASFEDRFANAYRADMQAIDAKIESMPKRLRMREIGESGVETRALQKYLSESGEEMETGMTLAEAAAMEDPDVMARLALQRVQNASLTDKFTKEHPIQAAAFEFGKAALSAKLGEAFLGISGGTPARKRIGGPPKGFG